MNFRYVHCEKSLKYEKEDRFLSILKSMELGMVFNLQGSQKFLKPNSLTIPGLP